MRWPPFPLSKYFFSRSTGLLLLILVPILNAPPTGIAHINGEKETVDPWSPAAIDQLKPYRLAEKRVHEKPGISWKWKRDRDDVNAQMEQRQELGADWRLAEPEQAKLLEQIPTIGPHDEFNFLANQSLLHLRTPTYSLQHKQCLEVHFRVEGKRTRLLLYTCRMYEGGLCVLDKFMATTNKKKLDQAEKSQLDMCHKLQPWMYLPSPFAFHFRFVRRPRKFADRESELRHFRRRYGRSATREVGRVQLTGFRSCDQACREEKAEDGTGEQLDVQQTNVQDQHIEDPLEGWG